MIIPVSDKSIGYLFSIEKHRNHPAMGPRGSGGSGGSGEGVNNIVSKYGRKFPGGQSIAVKEADTKAVSEFIKILPGIKIYQIRGMDVMKPIIAASSKDSVKSISAKLIKNQFVEINSSSKDRKLFENNGNKVSVQLKEDFAGTNLGRNVDYFASYKSSDFK